MTFSYTHLFNVDAKGENFQSVFIKRMMAFQSPTYCDSSSIGSMNEWACNDDD